MDFLNTRAIAERWPCAGVGYKAYYPLLADWREAHLLVRVRDWKVRRVPGANVPEYIYLVQRVAHLMCTQSQPIATLIYQEHCEQLRFEAQACRTEKENVSCG